MKPLHPAVSCRRTKQRITSGQTQKTSFVRTVGFFHYWKSHSPATDKSSMPISKVSVKQCNFSPHQDVYYSHFTIGNKSESFILSSLFCCHPSLQCKHTLTANLFLHAMNHALPTITLSAAEPSELLLTIWVHAIETFSRAITYAHSPLPLKGYNLKAVFCIPLHTCFTESI